MVNLSEGLLELDQAIEKLKSEKGALMPVLHEAQRIFGAVPLEVQTHISKKMHIPLADIYGVVTFYSHFTIEQDGKYTINVCLGTACYINGSKRILESISRTLNLQVNQTSKDGRFTLKETRCVGACGLAPVLTINGDVYGRLKDSDVSTILKKYL